MTMGLNQTELMPSVKWKEVPYDFFCPSVQSKLDSRICSCGKYFSSVTSLKAHRSLKKGCESFTPSIKAGRILAQKENEKLIVVNYDGEDDIEWVYDVDLDDDGKIFIEPESLENEIYDLEKVLAPIWEDEEEK